MKKIVPKIKVISRTCLSGYKIAEICYLCFWILKPFYIVESGSIQIGDLFLIISFLFVLFSSHVKIHILSDDKKLFFFVACVCIINSTYFLFYQNLSFLKSILYYIFNLLSIYIARIFFFNSKFLYTFANILKFNIVIQSLVFLMGFGRWYSGERYMGTYNDPNQFGFAIFSAFSLLYCINCKLHIKHIWTFFGISFFLVFQSSSTGMLLGMLIIFVCEQYFRLVTIKKRMYKAIYIMYLLIITIGIAWIFVEVCLMLIGELETNVFIFQRLGTKLSNGDSFIDSFLNDRNLEAVVNYPIVMLYGSGEGYMNRFGSSNLELHSTWIGVLFYYGGIPFYFLLSWIKQNLSKIDPYLLPVYISVFLEALTLINHRQPAFWLLFVMGSYIKKKEI